ncbi:MULTISPECIES: thiol peroxidase [Tessaracoccus]|uniref:thiol peroxidase n=1 Tax=Tessaracoccus TaxID=72763 RepID=UPI00099D8DA1|nr:MULTISPECIES: thiol peroxidase [Tessaracoccus]AQX16408.1 lipid hydroperoxide peroxidase [Tessaracoccus sp. T2.5-30]VEP41048.1 putative thiol peroxidase [Tessaracoccus lapidicaptus]
MAEITFKGNPIHTVGELPSVGSPAPDFELTGPDLSPVTLADYAGRTLVLNIFHSLDTGTCANSVRAFNQKAAGLDGVAVLNVSKDLPFAQKRFCGAEGIDNVDVASDFRSDFGQRYGVTYTDGPIRGLLSRAVVVIDPEGRVVYTEQVAESSEEPDYDAALAALS